MKTQVKNYLISNHTNMKNLKTIITLFILVLIAACSKDSDAPATADVPLLAITAINPATGPKNTPVTITGTGFSTTLGNNAVTLNGKVCPVVNSTSTQLTITIPPSAGLGKIKVAVAGANAESGNFEFVVTTTVTTIAGSSQGLLDGQGFAAQFNFLRGITLDTQGNLLIADGDRIRKVSSNGLVTTIAGSGVQGSVDGQGILARIGSPNGIAIASDGVIYFGSASGATIGRISQTGFVIAQFAGDLPSGFADGRGANARFQIPKGLTIDATGNIYIADQSNEKIRKMAPNGQVTTIAGSTRGFADGQATIAQFDTPQDVAIDASGNLFIADMLNNKIRKISSTGVVTTIAGSTQGFADGQGVSAKFTNPKGITIDAIGNLYIADSGNNKIRKISSIGLVTTIAGSSNGSIDGNGATAQFNGVNKMTIDAQGNLYLTDSDNAGNDKIRKITFD